MNGTETILEVVQQHIRAFNDGDIDRFKSTLTRDAVMAFRAVDRVCRGADDITTAYWALREHFDGLHLQVTNAFSTGTYASVELVRSCNSKFTGVRVTVPECMVFTIRQEHIATISYYTDRMTELVQLGAIADLQAPLPTDLPTEYVHDATARPQRFQNVLRIVSRRARQKAS